MGKGRLEAFSDGVLAIIITIMVLELRPPELTTWEALTHLQSKILTYALSFVFLGIYWNNHHHMLHASKHVNGAILWANLHLLFWLSLVPFATAWMGEHPFTPVPTATYGSVLLLAAISYTILMKLLIAQEGPESALARAVGDNRKGNVSLLLYIVAIPAAFVHPGLANLLFVAVALIWLVPDRRIERVLRD
jgi:TMEM175 potassium channel family protein